MSGHNKFSKIKHLKAKNDANKSKIYGKLVRLIAVEAKKCGGNMTSPSLLAAIEKARKENMPNDTIERAVKKATADNSAAMESILYEAYGPGGVAILIHALTDNRNKASQEIKTILHKNDISLAGPGSASWAFEKNADGWQATVTVPLDETDSDKLLSIVEELEENDEVQNVYTNAE
ncbi:MAG: YebC/PmpR family DNA-binding transcriptional regulator [Patescibacteria group bacterium]|nr:YebC/PmpR family DNA-binding transcriptional regulator [Patescibacteria group bacterium]